MNYDWRRLAVARHLSAVMSLMAKPTTRFMRTMLITTRKAAKRILAIQGVDGSGLVHAALADLKTTYPVPCMQVQESPKSVLSHVWRC